MFVYTSAPLACIPLSHLSLYASLSLFSLFHCLCLHVTCSHSVILFVKNTLFLYLFSVAQWLSYTSLINSFHIQNPILFENGAFSISSIFFNKRWRTSSLCFSMSSRYLQNVQVAGILGIYYFCNNFKMNYSSSRDPSHHVKWHNDESNMVISVHFHLNNNY